MAPGKHSYDADSYNDDYNQKNYSNSYENDYEDDDDYEGFDKKKAIIIGVVIGVIVAIIAIIGINSKKQENKNTNTVNSATSGMVEKHNGYDVLGKIVIEELGVEQYILDSKEDKALENGVIRLCGGSLNNYGNFCIAGHNKSGVFDKLSEMEVGDLFTVIEPDLKETKYKITEIYSVEATDLKCLLQDDEKIEITLITCENASTTRLVVKAEEV